MQHVFEDMVNKIKIKNCVTKADSSGPNYVDNGNKNNLRVSYKKLMNVKLALPHTINPEIKIS